MPDTVLTATIGIGECVLPVAADPGPGPLFIDSEAMLVVSRGITSILVTRAAFGTTVAGHAVGAAVVDAAPAFVGTNTGLVLSGGITSTPTEINYLHGVTPGVAPVSKVAILGANKNLDTLVLPVGGLMIGPTAGTSVTPTAAELNTLHSSGITNQDLINAHAAIPGAPLYGLTGFKAETIPRQLCPEANVAALATTQIFNQLIYIPGGTIVTSVTFWSATQAASAPTHYAFGLYNYSASAPTLIGTTADQTSTAWAANTMLTLPLTGGPFTITTSGLYYVAIGMTATTAVSLKGMAVRTDGTLNAGAPIMAGINATSNPAGVLPGTLGAITPGLNSVWCGLS
jgi:hypothetical protein